MSRNLYSLGVFFFLLFLFQLWFKNAFKKSLRKKQTFWKIWMHKWKERKVWPSWVQRKLNKIMWPMLPAHLEGRRRSTGSSPLCASWLSPALSGSSCTEDGDVSSPCCSCWRVTNNHKDVFLDTQSNKLISTYVSTDKFYIKYSNSQIYRIGADHEDEIIDFEAEEI